MDYSGLKLAYAGLNYRVYPDPANNTVVVYDSSFYYSFRDADLKNLLSQVSYKVPAFAKAVPLEQQPDWLKQFLQANGFPTTSVRLADNKVANLSSVLEEFDTISLIMVLSEQPYNNLLIDVRDNTGGSINMRLVAYLARDNWKLPTRELVYVPLLRQDNDYLQALLSMVDSPMRKIILDQLARDPTATRSVRLPFFCKTSNCTVDEAVYPPDTSHKKFNVAVLSGPVCMSSCDQFVAMVKDNGIGKVLGLPSRGADSPMRAQKAFSLKNGDKFSLIFSAGNGYRPNGELLEGNPAKVDYYLYPEDGYIGKMEQVLLQGTRAAEPQTASAY